VVTISLPLPSPKLHAHAKGGHWSKKSRATKTARALAFAEALAERGSVAYEEFEGTYEFAILSIDFYYPDMILRDILNSVQGLKPYIDGLADAGIIENDDWLHMSIGYIKAHLDRDDPRVVLTIEDAMSETCPTCGQPRLAGPLDLLKEHLWNGCWQGP